MIATHDILTPCTPLSESSETLSGMVESLLTAIEAKDFKARRHSERVARHVLQIAERLELPLDECERLRIGALLHDIGNLGIPDAILLKPGGLSPLEFDEMKLHPIIGEQICRPVSALVTVLPLLRNHHEKLDGTGYPDQLAGDEIPLLVRVLSVADVYDTLRSERAYRHAFTHEEAINILREEVERGWWDTNVVEILADLTAPQADFAPV